MASEHESAKDYEIALLKAQRDELLAALKELAQSANYVLVNHYRQITGKLKFGEDVERAQAVIAKSEGK